jgi:hypothetical protein
VTHRQITLKEANAFVGVVHRHHRAVVGCRFALGAFEGEKLVGAVIVGRTVARGAHSVHRAEVTRLATDGTRNACSYLYAAAKRVVQAMGYTSLITYTLASEPGDSLRAVKAKDKGIVKGRSWSCESRPRTDKHPTEDKRRWELIA